MLGGSGDLISKVICTFTGAVSSCDYSYLISQRVHIHYYQGIRSQKTILIS